MLKNLKKKKSASINTSCDYQCFDNISNPYDFNFGSLEKNNYNTMFSKLQNRVNMDYFYKK